MNITTMAKKKKALITVVVLFLTFQLAGCSSIQVGQEFDVQLFKSMVQPHVTTKAQVHAWLGAPTSTGVSLDKNGEQSDEWVYFHGTGKLSKMEAAKLKMLQIRFDKNGIINSYNWSSSKE
jgi:outer membrane protein assembly factor BamE (lipoprotein component of BamABCDE complex)